MKKVILITFLFLTGIFSSLPLSAQFQKDLYTIRNRESRSITIENGQLYRITIKSCWYSADACIGTYLIYGLNISDPKTHGQPKILIVAETTTIDWRYSFRLSGDYNADMRITSLGWGDQGLLIVVEKLSGY